MKYIIGAYATAPSLCHNDEALENDFYVKLKRDIPEIRGLEVPYWGKGIHQFGSEYLLNIIEPHWDNVLSCIPGTMGELVKNPKFGLASDDKDGRLAAIFMQKRVNKILHTMNDKYSRKSIISVQMVSAPSFPVEGVSSSIDSLKSSMDEILSWDWGGARLVIEHCDASIPNQSFDKGFFRLEEEIDMLLSLQSEHKLGVTINWARSAIEGRSPDKPIEHLKLASQHNLLSGLIFSGVSENDDRYGQWNDTHMPFAQSYDVEHYEENSLLNQQNMTKALNEVDLDKLDYLGIKILSMPMDSSSLERRVGLNRDAISILNNIMSH